MERGPSSIHAAQNRRYAAVRGEEVSRNSRGGVRCCAQRRGDRRREHANSRAGVAGENVRSARRERTRSTINVRPFAPCATTRRAAPWRNRVRARSPGDAGLRRRSDPRRNRIPEKQSRHRLDDAVARRRRFPAAARIADKSEWGKEVESRTTILSLSAPLIEFSPSAALPRFAEQLLLETCSH